MWRPTHTQVKETPNIGTQDTQKDGLLSVDKAGVISPILQNERDFFTFSDCCSDKTKTFYIEQLFTKDIVAIQTIFHGETLSLHSIKQTTHSAIIN